MNDILESMQREINRLKRQVEAFQSGGYATVQFVPLTIPLSSTSWDGDAHSTEAKTLLDLSSVFSAPAGIKAALFFVGVKDSASAANDCYIVLGPGSSAGVGMAVNCSEVNDRVSRETVVVPCDVNGDIYYQIAASGASTFDATLQIWGYWI